MAGEIQLTATHHRTAYLSLTAPQQAYLLLEVLPSSAALAPQAVNLCLVLDRSGSMAGEKLRQLIEAAKGIVDRLHVTDMLSVIIFDDTAQVVLPAGPVQDQQQIKNKIEAIVERGGTHMSTGMEAGLKELLRGQSPERVSRMVLLTDGQTWEDQARCESLAEDCRQAGIPLTALGLGVGEENNWDARLLDDLAMRSGGDWTVVDSPEKVRAVFDSLLQEAQGAAVTNTALTMRFVEGVEVRTVWRVTPLINRLSHQAIGLRDVQVFLGDVAHGTGQSVLAELLLPPRKPGAYRIAQADVTYDVPASGLTRQQAVVDVITPFTEDAALASRTSGRVMNLIERVVAHKLQTQALDEAAAGDISRATQRLRAAATRLLDLGEVEMAEQANQQALQLEEGGRLDPAAAQRMRYATRRLTEEELSNPST